MTVTDGTRSRTTGELRSHLIDLKKEQFNLRFQKASGQLENTARVRQVRRQIAQVKTILREKNRDLLRGGEQRCQGE